MSVSEVSSHHNALYDCKMFHTNYNFSSYNECARSTDNDCDKNAECTDTPDGCVYSVKLICTPNIVTHASVKRDTLMTVQILLNADDDASVGFADIFNKLL